MPETEKPICEMFDKMMMLGLKHGVESIKDYDGPWIQVVDHLWTFAVNGKDDPVKVDLEGTMGVSELRPFHAAVWFNGWLAGIINPYGGEFAAGSAANENSFINALDAALAAPTTTAGN